ncbi:hypothetical protein [Hafnia paralvei]|uniref:hypothetical protein n=1 Tax=Hafnia paralvei TaxID=546367 RepID=UPI00187D0FFD|nr:hypothetical protein [Hafnia paralvei]
MTGKWQQNYQVSGMHYALKNSCVVLIFLPGLTHHHFAVASFMLPNIAVSTSGFCMLM